MPRRFKLVRRIRKLKQRFEPDASMARIRYGIRQFVRHNRSLVTCEVAVALGAGALVWFAIGSFSRTAGIIGGPVAAVIVVVACLRHNIGRVRHYMDRAVRRPLPPRR